MKKAWLVVGLVAFLVFSVVTQAKSSEWQGYASVYGTFINFSDSSLKDDGWAMTAYGNIGDGKHHLIEAAISQTYLDYKTQSDLDQTDFTIAYTNTDQLLSNHSFRFGFHYIISDDTQTDKGKIFFAKVTYFMPYNWDAGLELDYSLYDNTSPDLDIFQFLPHFGIYLKGLLPKGTLYTESKFYYIHKDKDVGNLRKDDFFSFEQSLSYFLKPWDIKISGWAGEQIFAVKNAGFVVYNLADKYKGGITLEVGYTFLTGLRAALNVTNEWLKHVGYAETVKETIVSLSVGTKF